MTTLLALVFAAFLAFTAGCFDGTSTKATASSATLPTQTSEGVALHGCGSGSGWIENTNTYPVRVRLVWRFNGEKTISIDRLEPGKKLSLDHISHQHGFYIYTMDGTLVGWILGACPKK